MLSSSTNGAGIFLSLYDDQNPYDYRLWNEEFSIEREKERRYWLYHLSTASEIYWTDTLHKTQTITNTQIKRLPFTHTAENRSSKKRRRRRGNGRLGTGRIPDSMTLVGEDNESDARNGAHRRRKRHEQQLLARLERRVEAGNRVGVEKADDSEDEDRESSVNEVPREELVFGEICGRRIWVRKW